MTTEMTLQQALDMANSAHASKQEKILAKEVDRLRGLLDIETAARIRFLRCFPPELRGERS